MASRPNAREISLADFEAKPKKKAARLPKQPRRRVLLHIGINLVFVGFVMLRCDSI
jgi:hypothetical protein